MEAAEKWDEPVFGPGRYMGRRQSVAALARSLLAGSSVTVLGGAKIGKTSLLRQVALEMGECAAVLSGPDLMMHPGALTDAVKRLKVASRPCLLVDDADALAIPDGRGVLVALASLAREGAAGLQVALCFAGTRRWQEATANPGCPLLCGGVHLKPFPMAVWDRRLAGALIAQAAPGAPVSHVGALISLAGNHPFLLRGLLTRGPDIDAALEACRGGFERAFASWLDQMGPGVSADDGGLDARPLMRLLVERPTYIAFDSARRRLARPDLKAEADLLCWLGVVDRRLRGDEATATLRAGCGLFNEWYRARA